MNPTTHEKISYKKGDGGRRRTTFPPERATSGWTRQLLALGLLALALRAFGLYPTPGREHDHGVRRGRESRSLGAPCGLAAEHLGAHEPGLDVQARVRAEDPLGVRVDTGSQAHDVGRWCAVLVEPQPVYVHSDDAVAHPEPLGLRHVLQQVRTAAHVDPVHGSALEPLHRRGVTVRGRQVGRAAGVTVRAHPHPLVDRDVQGDTTAQGCSPGTDRGGEEHVGHGHARLGHARQRAVVLGAVVAVVVAVAVPVPVRVLLVEGLGAHVGQGAVVLVVVTVAVPVPVGVELVEGEDAGIRVRDVRVTVTMATALRRVRLPERSTRVSACWMRPPSHVSRCWPRATLCWACLDWSMESMP